MEYQPGETIADKYRIEEFLGQGGFGEVYRVTHLKLNAPRAMKILRKDTPAMSSQYIEKYRNLFGTEAQLGARFKQANLVQVHDFEEVQETLILVMEYCPGGDLRKRILDLDERGAMMSVEEVVRIGIEIAEGLACLHGKDVVHRDVKPSNILFGAGGEAKVGDLGLAQTPYSRMSGGSLGMEHPGTFEYMPPEQKPPNWGALRASADVYALGCVLFEMLTGRMYFHQDPGTKPGELREDVPDWLNDLVGQMLAEKAVERPKNGKIAASLLKQEVDEKARLEAEALAKKVKDEKARLEAEALAKKVKDEKVRLKAEVNAKKVKDEKARLEAEALAKKEAEEMAARLEAEALAKKEADEIKAKLEAEALAKKEADEIKARLKAEALAKKEAGEMAARLEAKKSREKQPGAVREEGGSEFVQLGDGVEMEFVRVPAGEFNMGSEDNENEKPVHKVYLDEYWIGRYPVTNAQYGCYVKEQGNKVPAHWQRDLPPAGKERHPVVNVNWADSNGFCDWLNGNLQAAMGKGSVRLPSEAEWEKAARGTDARKYPWGNQEPDIRLCNYGSNEGGTTMVGKYSPVGDSPYGCADMAGNVWEWVNDWYGDYPSGRQNNPTGPTTGKSRILRGGSWYYTFQIARSADRLRSGPVGRSSHYGFRCARRAAP